MKKYSATGYLIGAIFALLLSGLYSLPAWPFFITRLIPFPTLEQAKIYEGTLHVKGSAHRTLNHSWTAPSYFVIDEQKQKHEIFWGYPANEREAYDSIAEGMKIKVWFNDYYGVIQQHAVATPEMIKHFPDYQKDPNIVAGYDYFKKEYEYVRFEKDHFWYLFTPMMMLLFAGYYFIQFTRTRKTEKESKNGSNV
jgi:hypothetical protein